MAEIVKTAEGTVVGLIPDKYLKSEESKPSETTEKPKRASRKTEKN